MLSRSLTSSSNLRSLVAIYLVVARDGAGAQPPLHQAYLKLFPWFDHRGIDHDRRIAGLANYCVAAFENSKRRERIEPGRQLGQPMAAVRNCRGRTGS